MWITFLPMQGNYGGDVRKFEPVFAAKSLNCSRVDRIVRDLRRLYKKDPAYFDVPAFVQKVY